MERRVIDTPIGLLTLFASSGRLVEIRFPTAGSHEDPESDTTSATAVLDRTERQLGEYFAGDRQAFDLPLGPRGTDFQRRVWSALEEIPFGATTSYGALAASLGAPGSARAVGLANGSNPLSIVVPCHRVIGADGSLTGYGGGLERKLWLLRHEGATTATVGEQTALF